MLDLGPLYWRIFACVEGFPPEAKGEPRVGDVFVGVSGGEVGLPPATVWPMFNAGALVHILSEWAFLFW